MQEKLREESRGKSDFFPQNFEFWEEKEKFSSKSRISRGEWELVLQNLDNREHLEKWKFNSPVQDIKKWESRQCLISIFDH